MYLYPLLSPIPLFRVHHTPLNEKGQTKAKTACHICKCTDASEIITYIKVKYCGYINIFFPHEGIVSSNLCMKKQKESLRTLKCSKQMLVPKIQK